MVASELWESRLCLWQQIESCFIGHRMKGWLGAWEWLWSWTRYTGPPTASLLLQDLFLIQTHATCLPKPGTARLGFSRGCCPVESTFPTELVSLLTHTQANTICLYISLYRGSDHVDPLSLINQYFSKESHHRFSSRRDSNSFWCVTSAILVLGFPAGATA